MTPQQFREIVNSYQLSRVILTSIELKLYNILDNGFKTPGEVAEHLSSDEKAIDRLMNSLCTIELLRKKDGKFSNTEFSSKYLVEGKPDFFSNLFHTVDLWKSWSNLTEAVYNGKPVQDINEKREENRIENFISAMHYRAEKQAPADIKLLDLRNVKNALDLGGGSGAYAIEFVKMNKEINAIVFDLPDVIPLTNKYIKDAGLETKIKTKKGNYLIDPIGKDYDLIFLSAIVHSNSFEENKKLIKKCADALNKNGQVVVQDFVMDEDRTSPAFGTFFALNMLVNTQSGDTYTEKEISSWLTDSGLSKIERKETPHGASQVIGKKI